MSSDPTIENKDRAESRLRVSRGRLISDFLTKAVPDFLLQHTRILDEYFFERFETSRVGPSLGIDRNPFAIVALGGYGRREQCIYSDIDLLFLFRKKIPKQSEALIQEVVYPLWDIGLEVGYSIRTLKECIGLAERDPEVLTALLDARIICGASHLYMEMKSSLAESLFRTRGNAFISRLVERNSERHLRFGDSSYLLEPNLKEGHGGLRDYHTMLWIARIRSGLKEPRDLEYDGYLSHDEYLSFSDAVSFIWYVRNHLHFITKRKCDQLYFEYQKKLADLMEFKPKDGLQPVEGFLGMLHGHMEYIKRTHEMFLYQLGFSRRLRRDSGNKALQEKKGLRIERGALHFDSPKSILKRPALLLEIFKESAQLKLPLSVEARRLVKDFLHLADDSLVDSSSGVKAFEKILSSRVPQFNVLDDMAGAGLLNRFIPELGAITNRIQYDDYHLFPVDRHLLRTVETIKGFGDSPDLLCATLYIELKRKKPLLWAALLHDIGKGLPGKGHSLAGAQMARRILHRKGLKPEDIETAAFLIEYHLYLIETATRRDIHDEETAVFCAKEIKDIERLKMLYLLTVADSQSTGPKAWNDWTAALLRDFFLKVLTTLERGELTSEESVALIESNKAKALEAIREDSEREGLESLLQAMSPRYLLYARPHQILEHGRLYGQLGDSEFVWRIDREHESDTRQVTICAKDRPGLLSKIAGVFTLNGLNILDVQVFTWRNNIALDIFRVEPPPDQIFESERWLRAQKHLSSALAGQMDLRAELSRRMSDYKIKSRIRTGRKAEVVIENRSSSFYTIIEVFAYDYPGLLFLITDALFRCRLDVWVAKIGTKIDQVVDVFYVRDFDGQKVDSPEQVAAIESAVMEVIRS